MREGGKTPERERLGVAYDDLALHQNIVDQQDEKVVGQDAQRCPTIKSEGFGTADMVVVLFEMRDERLRNEEAGHDKEDVNAMRHGHISKAVERRVEQDLLGVALHHAKNGESPQQVQPEDTFAVNIDAPEVLHPW